jgi:hypothetical protein
MYHLHVALPIQSHINICVLKPLCTRFILGWVISGLDFSSPRLRSWSFRFCVTILLLTSYPCIVYPHIGDFTNLAGYPPLKPNIIFCDDLLDHNLSLTMDLQFKENRNMVPTLKISSISPKENYFPYLPYLYHLFAQGRTNV